MTPRSATPATPAHDDAFAALTEQIVQARGVPVGSYKRGCLERRIASRMRVRGAENYLAYARVLRDDPTEYDALLDALTINVTHLFRDTDVWAGVAENVLPPLWDSAHEPIRTWVAGCASGEEAYTVAALWHQFVEERGDLARVGRLKITASDLDPGALALAAEGSFAREAFRDTPAHVRTRYFTPGEPHVAARELRSMLTFERGDLLATAPASGSVHLITCRNVLIYFDRPSQDAVFARFHDSLAPGGFLVLGKAEAMLGDSRHLFDAVDLRRRLFRRR